MKESAMMKTVLMSLIFLLLVNSAQLFSQQVTKAQLAKALSECEADLEVSKQQIRKLSDALQATDNLIERHRAVSDSLISNLRQQLFIQDSVSALLKINADTLQTMVRDFQKKLDEVDRLYISELKKQSRPWYLTGHGLKGLIYGVFIGGALGLVFSLAH